MDLPCFVLVYGLDAGYELTDTRLQINYLCTCSGLCVLLLGHHYLLQWEGRREEKRIAERWTEGEKGEEKQQQQQNTEEQEGGRGGEEEQWKEEW